MPIAGKICLTDCGVENCALMVLILLTKNVANSSVVRVDEGGGGGGQRSEEKIVCPFSSGDICREGREE